ARTLGVRLRSATDPPLSHSTTPQYSKTIKILTISSDFRHLQEITPRGLALDLPGFSDSQRESPPSS
ncbi:hypothetical protein OAH36_04485, partial [Verrucomicrobia bacterium]|nr:hypothetical protein [Verrucomicrobiota bacterium]